MNKKIKVIDLIDKIYHKNNIPKRIKYKYKVWLYDNVEERYCLEESCFVTLSFETDRLNDEIEILEDNTEEIEELKPVKDRLTYRYEWSEIPNKINELVKAVNSIRKEKK